MSIQATPNWLADARALFRAPARPTVCRNCGQPPRDWLRRGRCAACNQWLRRHGTERPLGPCPHCGRGR